MLDYNQTKQLIDFASKADTFPKVEDFMQNTFQVPKGPQAIGTYKTALEQHAQLLTGKDPATLQRLLGFLTKRALIDSPLRNKLTPEQQKELQVASTSLLSKIITSSWIIHDWAGNVMFNGQKFNSFDDAEEFLSEKLDNTYETDRQEYEIVEGSTDPFLLKKILSDTHRTSDLQNMSGPKLLEMIRNKEVTYADVDAALEKVGKVQILDWLGDKLAADDLKKPVESLLSKIMAESDDRKAKPSNDVIDEVQPLKWKKAPHGQSAPVNLPMNPDAKSPAAPMEGMPVKSMLGKVLSTTANPETLIREWFTEHLQAQPTAELIDAILVDFNKTASPTDWDQDDIYISCRRVICQDLKLKSASTSMLSKVQADFQPLSGPESEPAESAHSEENLDTLKEAFNRFISEEMAEGDEHDQESLEALKDSFSKFLDEEMKEA